MMRKLPAGDTSELRWVKSSYSDSSNGSECVEVAAAGDAVHVRDSKNVQGPRLALAPAAWLGFLPYAAATGS
ncbi:DUF397 domain-containing protein [Streptomyces sp. HNA39]|uniref:DUF397 domain-containing protein n=1 Tax=Streptomyces sp. HNA39 TaxID=2850561 RepID=UPI00200DF9A8|nr:DUF397 domain-containing protein [Streptomyces sp. HNA39]UQA34477.1 DUF397 domain-containing protein [Streptomyces sp. HNA39]